MTAAERAIADVLTFRRFWGDAWAIHRLEIAAVDIARESMRRALKESGLPERPRDHVGSHDVAGDDEAAGVGQAPELGSLGIGREGVHERADDGDDDRHEGDE